VTRVPHFTAILPAAESSLEPGKITRKGALRASRVLPCGHLAPDLPRIGSRLPGGRGSAEPSPSELAERLADVAGNLIATETGVQPKPTGSGRSQPR
jgi:hypothetical protein